MSTRITAAEPLPQHPLGASGLMVSRAGLGTNAFGERLDPERSAAVVASALDAGITFFDTADIYGHGESERILGSVIGSAREDVVIATKAGMDAGGLNGVDHGARASRRYLRRAVEGSLQRLGTDYIDLYQLHWPDGITPMDETLAAMNELIAEGKVRYIGCSHFSGWQLVDAAWRARTAGLQGFISTQSEYSLYNRHAEAEIVPACLSAGMSLLPYFPLASGLLTGKYRSTEAAPEGALLSSGPKAERLQQADWALLDDLDAFARERDISLLELAIGGLAAQPAVASVIAGATTPEQVRANAAAAAWTPTPEDLAELDRIEERHEAGSLARYFTPGRI